MAFPERRTVNVLLTILLFAVVCALVYSARQVILIFVLAIFFAYLMNPAVKFLQRHSLFSKELRGAAVVKVYLTILLVIGVAGYWLVPRIARNTAKLIDEFPVFVDRLSTGEIATDLGEKYGWSDAQEARVRVFLARHRDNTQGLVRLVDRSLPQAAQIVGWLILIPILAIFLLQDGDHIADAAIKVAFPESQRQQARLVADHLHTMLTNYIRAQVFLCGLSFVFYAAVLLLFRFPYPIALSILGGALEFIPVMGWMSTAAAIIGTGIVNHLHWIWMAVLLLMWRLAQDYFNLPRIMGRQLEIHALTAIFAVLVGAEVGGIVGIYLSVPLAASIHVIWALVGDTKQLGQLSPEPGPLEREVAPEIPSSIINTTRN